MKLTLVVCLLAFMPGLPVCAQQLSIHAGTGVGLIENNYRAFSAPSAYLGRITYSNSLNLFGLRYNAGLEFGEDIWGYRPLLQAGLSAVFLRPSGFYKAASAEDVSYSTTKLYLSVDLNSFHGVSGLSDTLVYHWAVEPALVLGFPLARKWLLLGTFSSRYSRVPAYYTTSRAYGTLQFLVSLGVSKTLGRTGYKP